jgi:esterase
MDLFYREFGSGKPLIILHGLFGQSDNWVSVGKRLAAHFHVYIPDQRNHGQSPHTSTHTFQAMADDLAAFTETHGIHDPVIIGHSMGGKVAMTYALENPAMVSKLVIVDISPRQYPEREVHTRVMTQMLGIDLEKAGTRTEVTQILNERIPDERIRMFILKNLYYRLNGKLGWRLNLDAISNSMDQLFEAVSAEGVFTGPALFIRGGKSDYVPDEDFPLIRQLFPQSEIRTIAEASHWVHADAPAELILLLDEFLKTENNTR